MNKKPEILNMTTIYKTEDYKKSCFEDIKLILTTEMKQPLSKTGIYQKHLTRKNISGLSSTAYFSRYFDLLIENGLLRELPDRKGLYEYLPKTS